MVESMRFFKALLFCICLSLPAHAADKDQARLNSDLVYKAQFGKAEDVAILLESGADPESANALDQSAMAIAAQRKEDEGINIMEALVKSGANIDGRDPNNQTPLFYAARTGNLDAVKWLLAHGADYAAYDKNNNTARTLAFSQGHKHIQEYMDEFVKRLSAERNAQYEQMNKEIQANYIERQKEIIARERRLVEEQKELERQRRMLDESKQKATQKDRETAYNAAKADNEKLEDLYESGAFEKSLRTLSFEACAFQYWSYVRDVRVTAEPGEEELNALIHRYANSVPALRRELRETYRLRREYLNRIVNPSQNKIQSQLASLGSNATLAKEGVGRKADAEKRCREIANSWRMELRKE